MYQYCPTRRYGNFKLIRYLHQGNINYSIPLWVSASVGDIYQGIPQCDTLVFIIFTIAEEGRRRARGGRRGERREFSLSNESSSVISYTSMAPCESL